MFSKPSPESLEGSQRRGGLGRDLLVGIAVSLALLLILFATGRALGQTDHERAAEAFEAAERLLDQERYGRAADSFREVYEQYRESTYAAQALYWQAFALYREGSLRDLKLASRVLQRQSEEFNRQARRGDSGELAVLIQEKLAERGDARAAREIAELAEELGAEPSEHEQGRYSDEAKMQALQALLQMHPERALPILEKMLVSEPQRYTTDMREHALFLVAETGEEEAVEILLHVIRNDPSSELREGAVFWLSQTDDERGFEVLSELLMDSGQPEDVREKAVFGLSQIGGPEAASILRDLALDSSAPEDLRSQGIFWLHQLEGDDNAEFLRELYLQLDESELKEQVIFAVAQVGGSDSVDWMLDLARDENEDVEMRNQALFWAAQMGSVDAATYLEIFEEVEDPEVREQVVFGLSQMGTPESIDALVHLARNADDPELREQAVFWIGQADDERAVDFLLEIIEED